MGGGLFCVLSSNYSLFCSPLLATFLLFLLMGGRIIIISPLKYQRIGRREDSLLDGILRIHLHFLPGSPSVFTFHHDNHYAFARKPVLEDISEREFERDHPWTAGLLLDSSQPTLTDLTPYCGNKEKEKARHLHHLLCSLGTNSPATRIILDQPFALTCRAVDFIPNEGPWQDQVYQNSRSQAASCSRRYHNHHRYHRPLASGPPLADAVVGVADETGAGGRWIGRQCMNKGAAAGGGPC